MRSERRWRDSARQHTGRVVVMGTYVEQVLLVAVLCATRVGAAEQSAAMSATPADTAVRKAALIFRYDDVGAYSAQSNSAAFEIDQAVFAAFADFDLPLVAGVVPGTVAVGGTVSVPEITWLSEEQEEGAWLLERSGRQRVEIAQHGVTHVRVAAGLQSEFHGVPFEVQREMILAGKRHLERMFRRPIRTFIPPWNSYDGNTLRALQDLGFDCISDDWKGATYSDVLCRIPQTTSLEQLFSILSHYDEIPAGSLIVVLFHSYDFVAGGEDEGGMSVAKLRKLLALVVGRDDLECTGISEFVAEWSRVYTKQRHDAAEQFVAWKSYLRGLPGQDTLVRDARPGILFPETYYDAAIPRVALLGAVAIVVSLALGALVARGVIRVTGLATFARFRRVVDIVGLLAVIMPAFIITSRLVEGSGIGSRMTCASAFAFGFCLACFVPRRCRMPIC